MACCICDRAGHDEELHGEEGEEILTLRAETRTLRRALEDAAAVFDDIVAAEKADGTRNSYPAQVARSGARSARAALLPGEEQSKP